MSITQSGAAPQPPKRDIRYRFVTASNGQMLFRVGMLADGSLHNPNGYPEELVRPAVLAAIERDHKRRSDGAKQAAKTRARRVEKMIHKAARQLIANEKFEPQDRCRICGKNLSDPPSISRGIGSDCWQQILDQIERWKADGTAPDLFSPSAASSTSGRAP
jgi:hypothetical protein